MMADTPTKSAWPNVDRDSHSVRGDVLLVAVLVALFGALRFYQLQSLDLSMDESFTRFFAIQNWRDLHFLVVENDMHPPLYFALAKIFVAFNDQELGVRFTSWALGTLTPIPMYFAGRFVGGRKAALLALILAGLSVTLLGMSQVARSYSAMTFCVAWALVPLAWIAAKPAEAARPVWRSSRSAALFLLAAVSVALLPWLHNIGAVYSLAIGLSALLIWAAQPDRAWTLLVNILLAGLLALVLYYPQLAHLVRQHHGVAGGFWAPDLSAKLLVKSLLLAFGAGDWPGKLALAGWCAGAFLIGYGAFGALRLVWRGQLALFFLTVSIPVLATVIIVVYSLFFEPIMLERLLFPAVAPWLLLLVVTITETGRNLLDKAAATAAGLIVAAGPLVYFGGLINPVDWRAVYHTVTSHSEGTPTILVLPNSAAILAEFHAAKLGHDVRLVPAEGSYPALRDGAIYPTGWQGVPQLSDHGLDGFDTAIAAAHGDVWLLLRSHWAYDPDNTLKARLDREYCYQIVKIPVEPYFLFVKLVPLAEAESQDCSTLRDMEAFPYMARREGDIPLERP